MAKGRRRSGPVSGRRTGGRVATRTGPATGGRSSGVTDKRLPFLLLQALAGTALLGVGVALGSLPVLPLLAFVLFVLCLSALPAVADRAARQRY